MGHTIAHRRRISGAVRRILATVCLALALAPDLCAQASPAPPDDPFADQAWHLQIEGHAATEAWNYNISHENLYGVILGFTYGLRKGLVLTARSPRYYVRQRGVNAWLVGTTAGVRGRIYRREPVSIFLEFDVGVSEADTLTPPGGTRFNYLALGSAGGTLRVRPGIHLVGSIRWIHVSNNGLAGRSRNPDIEAVGPQVGVLLKF